MKKQRKFKWQSVILATGVLVGGLWLQSGEGVAAHAYAHTTQSILQGSQAKGLVQQQTVVSQSENTFGETTNVVQNVAKKATKNKATPTVNSKTLNQYNGSIETAMDGTIIKVDGILKEGKT